MDYSSPPVSSRIEVDESFCHDAVKLLFDLQMSEDSDPCHSWWPEGKLTVCFVYWAFAELKAPEEFLEVLSSMLPSGTHYFGCKRKGYGVQNDYMAVLGFPFRLKSWKGLNDRLGLKDGDGQSEAEKVVFISVDPAVETPDDCVKFWSALCVVESIASQRFCSCSAAFEVKDGVELPSFVESVEDMWKSSQEDWVNVE
jgi:hypothetical protein